jgi:hypothetical protein
LFTSHGKYQFSFENNIVAITAIGPFNLEFFKAMHKDLVNFILQNAEVNNFAILLDLQGESLATQEGLDYHVKAVAKGVAKAIAVDLSTSFYPSSTADMFMKTYSKANLKNQAFNNRNNAIQWLNTIVNM